MSTIHHLFIIDPFNVLIPGHDTSLALMRAALESGHLVSQCEMQDILWEGHSVWACIRTVTKDGNRLGTEQEKKKVALTRDSRFIVWMRKDPPVDYHYLRVCQLLRVAKSQLPVLNDPDSLVGCDEKLLALEFSTISPKTWILQNMGEIKQLVRREQRLIVKSIGGKGGEGIFLLTVGDKNIGAILELATDYGRRKVICQEYLPQARQGDKRILLLDGEPLGALLRIPNEEDNRGNMAAGASIAKGEITERDLAICTAIRPRMRELGLYFVGIDIIGDKITEINITSPTCLEEISLLQKENLGAKVMAWCEKFYQAF